MYPSTYGEQFVSCEDRVRHYMSTRDRVLMDDLLTDLSRGFDSYRSGYHTAAARMIDAGEMGMVWDRAGYPYYVHPGFTPCGSCGWDTAVCVCHR